jgi:hypothetical protein
MKEKFSELRARFDAEKASAARLALAKEIEATTAKLEKLKAEYGV